MHNIAYSRLGGLQKSLTLYRKVPWWDKILEPDSEFVVRWNRIFLVTCLIALFIDPLYFYLIIIGGPGCMRFNTRLGIVVTFFRTIVDFFSLFHISMKFRTAFVAPNSRVFGRGDLVMDPSAIAMRYLKKDFLIDLAATLPLPQINKTTGAIAKTAWAGAAYNLLLYLLASHVIGAAWYVASIQRQDECWKLECRKEMNKTHSPSCQPIFLDCESLDKPERKAWLRRTHVLTNCDAFNDEKNFEFGMFADAFTDEVASAVFYEKYFYCLWFGLKSLSAYGQNLTTGTYSGEILFSIVICSMGLVLFSHLIGQVQSYLQSTTARLEQWRVKRRDTEEWMRHRQLPLHLQERVRRFVQYKWIATRGVDEESILRSLPLDLRRQIQRHLSLALVRRVPFFAQMDAQLLDAICERLVSSLNTKDTFLTREGDPVNEMLFIIRGQLESSTTNGGRSGFFNSITLRPGDFCGEELLTWALVPTPNLNFPSSTRTVKSLTEVEAFALRAEDLKFVASQFKRLHSKKLQHAFRYYSHQWRTWGSCFIQAAWRRYVKRRLAMELARQEELYYTTILDQDHHGSHGKEMMGSEGVGESSHGSKTTITTNNKVQNLGITMLASKFAANTRRGVHQKLAALESDAASLKMPKLFKPDEPDFSAFQNDN
ncbi:putative cyclic nucleotide-gated ion channel 16 [Cucumis melo var. makuwa]|uniref:Cyclic nucleotide-gated ion channel 16 n=1 Tax=Cucumis melo var. makuwa TaxID=1194695 RepID=A0A5A7URX7_CUCMM|nr:putative cyclic nucleotide-gated ion channel 16 [Cucumis melo var. makuwa]TYJ98565.1 putative cyclic nucleotide-gated ion channel 16 [Cucumis melo var. makuwa]